MIERWKNGKGGSFYDYNGFADPDVLLDWDVSDYGIFYKRIPRNEKHCEINELFISSNNLSSFTTICDKFTIVDPDAFVSNLQDCSNIINLQKAIYNSE